MPTFRTSQPVSKADVTRSHLILVGLPGAGKTTVARAVAEQLARQCLDLDAEIERREGVSIAEIFGARGEAGFRKLEYNLTAELRETGGMVLSPGAGWVANPGCVELLRPPASIIYLQVKPQVALTRMGATAASRPLLRRPDPIGELQRLLDARASLYLQSDHTVSTDKMSFQQVVDSIVALARA